ncbi:DUF6229 family protein [Catellatospora sp. NPDC049609]|uniref:DUF6229 family protein n=1 Tax=Catellatospora sp. NPDC049609 TaxID=3155505 RepID=UPI00344AE9B8
MSEFESDVVAAWRAGASEVDGVVNPAGPQFEVIPHSQEWGGTTDYTCPLTNCDPCDPC